MPKIHRNQHQGFFQNNNFKTYTSEIGDGLRLEWMLASFISERSIVPLELAIVTSESALQDY